MYNIKVTLSSDRQMSIIEISLEVAAFISVFTRSSVIKPIIRQAIEGISNSKEPSDTRGNLKQVFVTVY